MDVATKHRLDILQSCSVLASQLVRDIKLERVTAVWAQAFGLKITHAQPVVKCIYVISVFRYEGPRFTFT